MKVRATFALCLAAGLAAGCDRAADGNNITGADAAAAGGEEGQQRTSIGDALAGSADHSAFLQALQSAALIETLRGVGPYTVFAPNNAAFDALPEETRRRLAAPEQRERLITLLSYHVVPGTVTAEDLRRAIDRGPGGRAELATVTGGTLSLSRDGEAILIGDSAGALARITRADQIQSNGVVHSIDTVLMPGGAR